MQQLMIGGRAFKFELIDTMLKVTTPKKKVVSVDTIEFRTIDGRIDYNQVRRHIKKKYA